MEDLDLSDVMVRVNSISLLTFDLLLFAIKESCNN